MITNMLNAFSNYYDKYGNKIITDNYRMKQGLYVLVNKKGIKDYMFIEEKKEIVEEKKELYEYFKERDYLSILVLYDTNKSVAKKTIHSNNYLTLFLRVKSLFDKGKISESILKDINLYFATFEKWKSEEESIKKDINCKNPKIKILQNTADFNEDLFINSKYTMLETIKDIITIPEFEKLADADYIRVFYETDLQSYENEYRRYMVRKVFNKDKYHIFKNDKIYGLSNVDMGTNPNKPSLELKSMKAIVPFKIDFNTAIMLQKLYDFLFFYNTRKIDVKTGEVIHINSIYKTLYIPYDFNIEGIDLNVYNERPQATHYIKTGNGISFNIVDYDLLSPFVQKIGFNFKNFLILKDEVDELDEMDVEEIIENQEVINSILEDNSENELDYEPIYFLNQLEKAVNKYFFNYNLISNYFDDKISISAKYPIPKNLVNIIYISRNILHDWFKKGNYTGIDKSINKITKKILKEWISLVQEDNDLYKIRNILNLRLSIIEYFIREKGDYADMEQNFLVIRSKINNKIATKENIRSIESETEFYYLEAK